MKKLKKKIKLFNILLIVFFWIGLIFNSIAYNSLSPLVINFLYIAFGFLLLFLIDKNQLKFFAFIFLVCFFWSGISSFYANVLKDPNQVSNDAFFFYNLSVKNYSALSIDQLRAYYIGMAEGLGPLYLWQKVYDLFHFFGFEKERYIGIGFNSLIISFTSVLGLKIIESIEGFNENKKKYFIKIFSFCGVFFLFSSIHIRDSFSLFLITFLVFLFVDHMENKTKLLSIKFVVPFVIIQLSIGFVRTDFVVIPIIMFFLSYLSKLIANYNADNNTIYSKLFFIGFFIVTILSPFLFIEQINALRSNYAMISASSHGNESLGMKYIVNSNVFIRIPFGIVYLLVFPIPFWNGFFSDSSYDLLKSINSIFMIWLVPLVSFSIYQLTKNNLKRTPSKIFLVLIVIVFTTSIALTSLETRHLGSFLVPFLVLATLVSIENNSNNTTLKLMNILFYSSIFIVHLLWVVLKMV